MNTKIKLHVQKVTQETADTITIHFAQPQNELQYLSGQFLTLITEVNGKEERRSYSLCSSPYFDRNLSVSVKRVPGGKVSNYLNDAIKEGHTMEALSPMGNFKLKPSKEQQRHIVLIGGGSGITPLISILKSVLIQEPASKVSLIYVNKNQDSTIFYNEIQKWKLEFSSRLDVVHYWSDEMKIERKKQGFFSSLFKRSNKQVHRINTSKLTDIFSDLKILSSEATEFYICGPEGLMKIAEETIYSNGFTQDAIYRESFGNKTKPSMVGDSIPHQIKILLNGKEHNLEVKPKQSILFAGLDSGLDMPYSCQSGQCETCKGKCVSGKIEMSENEGLTESQVQDGYVLTCVGHPISDDIIIEFPTKKKTATNNVGKIIAVLC